MQIETSHATVQGIRMCGMPIIEHPKAGGPPVGGPPSGGPPANMPPAGPVPPEARYNVRNCLFAGNKKFTGSGGGPALNFRDSDPSLLNLIITKITDQPVQLELDQTKRNYLHVQEGTSGSDIGAGLFTKKAWAYPVVANGRLYIRDLDTMWCYDIQAAK
jgi:hypothetical protein